MAHLRPRASPAPQFRGYRYRYSCPAPEIRGYRYPGPALQIGGCRRHCPAACQLAALRRQSIQLVQGIRTFSGRQD